MQLKGKKVLVTGGAGFLGSHLCEGLLSEGAEVRILDAFSSGRESNISSFQDKVELINGKLVNGLVVTQATAGIDIVIHTAFPMEIREQKYVTEHLRLVTTGFFNLLEACLAENALFIEISSISVYGTPKYTPVDEDHPLEPETMYGAIKIAEELYCKMMSKNHGLKNVILRVADIYGPRNTRVSVPIAFLLKVMQNSPITVFGDGKQGRSYTYISDFVDGALRAIKNEEALGETINIGGNQWVSMLELAETVKDVIGGGSIILDPGKSSDNRVLDISSKKAQKLLSFAPRVDLSNGLKRTWDWIKENPDYYQV